MKKGISYLSLIVSALFVSVLFVVNQANTQDPIPQPPSFYSFDSLTTKGQVDTEHDEGSVKENFEIKVKFELDPLSNGIDPSNEHVTLEFDRGIAEGHEPQWLIQIPPTAWVLDQSGKGYRLVSSDPQQSGVEMYLDANGNGVTDLMPGITEFEAELKRKNGVWDLKIESIAEGDEPIWSPVMGSAVRTTITIGDDIGVSVAERLEIFQIEDPIW